MLQVVRFFMKKDDVINKIVSNEIKEDDNCEIITIYDTEDGVVSKLGLIPDKDITDLNWQTAIETYLCIEDGFRQRRIIYKCVYDSDKEEEAAG